MGYCGTCASFICRNAMAFESGDQKELLRTVSSSSYTQSTSPFKVVGLGEGATALIGVPVSFRLMIDRPWSRTNEMNSPLGENFGSSPEAEPVNPTWIPVPLRRSYIQRRPLESKRR